MKSKTYRLVLITLWALLLAGAVLLAGEPAQAALPTPDDDGWMLPMDGDHPGLTAADGAATGNSTLGVTENIEVDVLTLNISDEAPGHLIDALSAQGHADETLFEVLGYLKAQSSGVISDTFYNDVANAPPGSEVFTAELGNYVGLNGTIEISADGTVHVRDKWGSDYAGMPGYGTAPSQDGRFTLTYALDADHYIPTGAVYIDDGPITTKYNYYAFAIAWDEGYKVMLPFVARNMTPTFYDDFSDPNSGWYTGSGSGWSVSYLNGEYRIVLSENNYWAWGSPDRPLPGDYRIEVDARLTGNNEGSYSLIFGADLQDETGYEFAVFPMQQAYVILRYDYSGGTWEILEDEDYNPVINAGTATNRLRIDRIGTSIHAYVNGVLVATWDDDSYVGAGLAYGLGANSYDEGAVDARFDNFRASHTALDSPLYTDDFSVPGRWYEADHGWGQWSYQGAEYEILIRNTHYWAYAAVPLEGGLPRFALEADMHFATSTLGSYGLNFDQVDDHHLYSFIVMPGTQNYGLWKFDTDTWTPLVNWTASTAINAGAATNRLRVERDGEQIRLYANGTLLTSLSDASYVGNQEMSLYAASHADAPVAARFDNVAFSELP